MPIPRTTRFLTRTALLLSIALISQVFGHDLAVGLGLETYQMLFVGPFVNLCLLVATAYAGLWSGIAVAVLAPLGAYALGVQTEPVFLAVVSVANLILVLTFAVADHAAISLKHRPKLVVRSIGILVGAALKTAWLWGGVLVYIRLFAMKDALRDSMRFNFSWPQAVTVLVGGAFALGILLLLERPRPAMGRRPRTNP